MYKSKWKCMTHLLSVPLFLPQRRDKQSSWPCRDTCHMVTNISRFFMPNYSLYVQPFILLCMKVLLQFNSWQGMDHIFRIIHHQPWGKRRFRFNLKTVDYSRGTKYLYHTFLDVLLHCWYITAYISGLLLHCWRTIAYISELLSHFQWYIFAYW